MPAAKPTTAPRRMTRPARARRQQKGAGVIGSGMSGRIFTLDDDDNNPLLDVAEDNPDYEFELLYYKFSKGDLKEMGHEQVMANSSTQDMTVEELKEFLSDFRDTAVLKVIRRGSQAPNGEALNAKQAAKWEFFHNLSTVYALPPAAVEQLMPFVVDQGCVILGIRYGPPGSTASQRTYVSIHRRCSCDLKAYVQGTCAVPPPRDADTAREVMCKLVHRLLLTLAVLWYLGHRHHGDLSPTNILVREELPGIPQFYVCDFEGAAAGQPRVTSIPFQYTKCKFVDTEATKDEEIIQNMHVCHTTNDLVALARTVEQAAGTGRATNTIKGFLSAEDRGLFKSFAQQLEAVATRGVDGKQSHEMLESAYSLFAKMFNQPSAAGTLKQQVSQLWEGNLPRMPQANAANNAQNAQGGAGRRAQAATRKITTRKPAPATRKMAPATRKMAPATRKMAPATRKSRKMVQP